MTPGIDHSRPVLVDPRLSSQKVTPALYPYPGSYTLPLEQQYSQIPQRVYSSKFSLL